MKILRPLWLLCIAVGAVAQPAPTFEDGKGFFSYKQPIAAETLPDKRLKLVYFFQYDCDICLKGDDYLKQYAARYPHKVVLERYPYFPQGRLFTAKMHATFVELGRAELSDLYLFDSVGRKGAASLISSEAAVEKWLSHHQVDVEAFKRLFVSEQVAQRVEEYMAIYSKFRPILAPFLSINGRYILTESTLYNDDYTYAVLDFLYEQAQNGE